LEASKQIKEVAERKLPNGLSPVPDELLPPQGTLGFRVQLYGMLSWGDLFTVRQKLALVTLARHAELETEPSLRDALALAVSQLSELACSICPWEPLAECPRHIFSRQTVSMAWDFAEGVLVSDSSGSFGVCAENIASGVESLREISAATSPQIADACESPLPDIGSSV
jgi:adenine-specific DNA methylase